VTLQQNKDRIQTTHIGSLPRPHKLLDIMKKKFAGEAHDEGEFEKILAESVKQTVQKQKDCGIDIVTDGEFSKPGFFTYIQERLEGFEPRKGQKMILFQKEVEAFPDYYQEYFKQAMMGGTIVPITPVVCVGPVKYRGEKAVQRDIANVKAAAKAAGIPDHQVFLPATAPSGVGVNEYYKSDEDYFHALAVEMGKEYKAITDAGILVQIDDPFLPDIFVEPGLDEKQMKRRAQIYAEAVNEGLKGIPRERVRFHTCYGINEGPRLYEATLAQIIEYVLSINAGSYSFEAANPRHEHEYHLFESVKIPDGTVLCPGVITHASNIVEHPELIAERLIRFANLVGRENVMAGGDCGFSSQALYRTEVHDTVVWEKFKAMRQGADIATKKLWN
jgi:5-methyltetrahydropteroyltriglutamate--homocysteine methyltransferase